ncbi:hypothetical protein [Cognatilysobacter bugurensis]|uniref:Uracil-DNA glycosylase-like domain-containing protein n=1 Tax=Cognatilysobacter bugurensis TaxID=543356 RepID=A0A918W4Q6_9GAMM|nr:hypothetical protein [Lysobacter bugurensis]GHA72174.1 hypothetical protein GCM10007067_05800 [Lysobacter bugurensis]
MDTQSEKAQRLAPLVEKRRREVWPGYTGLGEYHDGAYEGDYVCPYSKSACNLDAPVMVLLQDWISHDAISQPIDPDMVRHGQLPKLATNRNLKRLLMQTFGLSLADIYATDLFPFVKPGGMSSRIPAAHLRRAAREFALPQIEVVAPALVICLGLATFNALREACGLKSVRPLDAAIEQPFGWRNSRIWCQAHTGGMGFNNRSRGDPGRVAGDWRRMRDSMAAESLRAVGDDRVSGALHPPIATSSSPAPTAQAQKACRICGRRLPASEFVYGNQVDRSYCRSCNKLERAAYACGGRAEAQAFRESQRRLWR